MDEKLASRGGSATVAIKDMFAVLVINILWTMMAGTQFSHDNEELKRIL